MKFVIFLALMLLTAPSLAGDLVICGRYPLVFPAQMPPAAQIISDVLSEDEAWRAGIEAFLNNSTNLTNQTGLIIA